MALTRVESIRDGEKWVDSGDVLELKFCDELHMADEGEEVSRMGSRVQAYPHA